MIGTHGSATGTCGHDGGRRSLAGRRCRAKRLGERGMVTAEWAIGVVVAVSLAGLLLIFIVKGPAKELLTGIILKIINLVSGWGLGQ